MLSYISNTNSTITTVRKVNYICIRRILQVVNYTDSNG
ncbi:unnamed protein product, partial [Rotaria socialis]